MKKTVLSIIAIFLFVAALAQTDEKIPKGGVKMLGPYPMKAFTLLNNQHGEMMYEEVDGQPSIKVNTFHVTDNPWDYQLSARTKNYTAEGDLMLLVFQARKLKSIDETGQVFTVAVFERASADYEKSISRQISAGAEWKTYYLPFTSSHSFPAGEAQVNFQVGIRKQTIEFKDIQLYNYKDRYKLEDMPQTEYTYSGREADAEWRKAAEARIEKHRKANIEFNFTDKKGNPLENVTINVKMQRHSYGFGTAVDANTLVLVDEYAEIIKKYFNKVVLENDLKWDGWERPSNRANTMKAIEWFEKNDLPLRGHVLVWPSWRWLPYHVKEHEDNPDKLRKVVFNHIEDEVSTLKGSIVEWDVMNEPYANHDLMDILGEDEMAKWFEKTREYDPDVKLYINEYGIIGHGGANKAQQDNYYRVIKKIKESGAPIQGIGVQSHYTWELTPPTQIIKILDRFAEFDLELQVTEFDVDVTDEQLQADYTRDFMTAVFSHPKTTGIMVWGFWENRHWRPDAAFFRENFEPKPNAKVWENLVFNQWWTNETINSSSGEVRGFLGEYTYEVVDEKGNVIKKGDFTLDKDGVKIDGKL